MLKDKLESKFTGVENYKGIICYYVDGLLHRENDLPAVEYYDGEKEWYIRGRFIKRKYPLEIKSRMQLFFRKKKFSIRAYSKYEYP